MWLIACEEREYFKRVIAVHWTPRVEYTEMNLLVSKQMPYLLPKVQLPALGSSNFRRALRSRRMALDMLLHISPSPPIVLLMAAKSGVRAPLSD